MALFTAIASGNWRDASTWDVGASYPHAADNVEIGDFAITLANDEACTNITFTGSGSAEAASVLGNKITASGLLTVDNNATMILTKVEIDCATYGDQTTSFINFAGTAGYPSKVLVSNNTTLNANCQNVGGVGVGIFQATGDIDFLGRMDNASAPLGTMTLHASSITLDSGSQISEFVKLIVPTTLYLQGMTWGFGGGPIDVSAVNSIVVNSGQITSTGILEIDPAKWNSPNGGVWNADLKVLGAITFTDNSSAAVFNGDIYFTGNTVINFSQSGSRLNTINLVAWAYPATLRYEDSNRSEDFTVLMAPIYAAGQNSMPVTHDWRW